MALINGQGYSHSDLTLGLLGNPLVIGFRAIEYGKDQAKNNVKGAQGLPQERTRGEVEYTGSLTLTVKEAKRIREAAGKNMLTDIPPFPITVTYANGVDAATSDILLFVEFTSDRISSSTGNELIEVTLPIIIGNILPNQ